MIKTFENLKLLKQSVLTFGCAYFILLNCLHSKFLFSLCVQNFIDLPGGPCPKQWESFEFVDFPREVTFNASFNGWYCDILRSLGRSFKTLLEATLWWTAWRHKGQRMATIVQDFARTRRAKILLARDQAFALRSRVVYKLFLELPLSLTLATSHRFNFIEIWFQIARWRGRLTFKWCQIIRSLDTIRV